MGIKGLKKVLSQYKLVKELDMEALRGKMVGIDLSLVMYQLIAVGEKLGLSYDVKGFSDDNVNNNLNNTNLNNKKEGELKDTTIARKEGELKDNSINTHHIQGIFYKTAKLLAAGITPVYFIDGPPPAAKHPTLEQRKLRATVKVGKGMFDQAIEIITMMGVECIQCPGEAEAQAAFCARNGQIEGIISEDTDIIALGAKLYTTVGGKLHCIDSDEVLAAMAMPREQFVDFCILLGCDYSSTLPGIGPVSALKQIREHKNIETILAKYGKPVPESFKYKDAREHLLTPLVNRECKFVGRSPISTNLRDRLLYYGISPDRIDKQLKKIMN